MGKRLDAYLEAVEKKRNPYENYKYAEGPQYFKEKELYEKWERENNAEYHKEQQRTKDEADAPRRAEVEKKNAKAQEIISKYIDQVPAILMEKSRSRPEPKRYQGTPEEQAEVIKRDDEEKSNIQAATNQAIEIAKKIVDELIAAELSEDEMDSFLRRIHSKLGITKNGYRIAEGALNYYYKKRKA